MNLDITRKCRRFHSIVNTEHRAHTDRTEGDKWPWKTSTVIEKEKGSQSRDNSIRQI